MEVPGTIKTSNKLEIIFSDCFPAVRDVLIKWTWLRYLEFVDSNCKSKSVLRGTTFWNSSHLDLLKEAQPPSVAVVKWRIVFPRTNLNFCQTTHQRESSFTANFFQVNLLHRSFGSIVRHICSVIPETKRKNLAWETSGLGWAIYRGVIAVESRKSG